MDRVHRGAERRTEPREQAVNIYAWIEYSYYDGLLTFAQLVVDVPDERITAWRVSWLNSEASNTGTKPS